MCDTERLELTLQAERLKGAECLMQALYESLQRGCSSGWVCYRFAELAGLDVRKHPIRCTLTGLVSVNNAIYDAHMFESKDES